MGDVNGDGRADLILASSGVRLSSAVSFDLITKITDGLGVDFQISYSTPLDNSVYTPETGSIYPLRDLLVSVPFNLVSEIVSDNGIGGQSVMDYHYTGAKVHLHGRGFLGFRAVEAHDQQTGITTETTYRQDYPYIGLPSRITKSTAGGALIHERDITYSAQSLGGTRYFPYAAHSSESRYELDGSLLSQTLTSQQYDAYGNPTQIVVTSNDGHTKTTVNTYDNDTTNWILGRLRRATVTSVAP